MNRVKIVNASGETLYLHLWQHIQERSISQEINMQEYEMSAGGIITSEPRLKSRRLKLGGSWFEQGVNSEVSSTAIQAKLLDGPLKLYQDEADSIYWDNVVLAGSSNVPNLYKIENQMGFEFILQDSLRRGAQKTEEWTNVEADFPSYPGHTITNYGQFPIMPDEILIEAITAGGRTIDPKVVAGGYVTVAELTGSYQNPNPVKMELDIFKATYETSMIVGNFTDDTLIKPLTIRAGTQTIYFRQYYNGGVVNGDVKTTIKFTERFI